MTNKFLTTAVALLFGLNFIACNYLSKTIPDGISVNSAGLSAIKDADSLKTVRSVHTATLLQDGTVLIAGGMNNAESALSSTEIYEPSVNKFSASANLSTPRVGHAAVLLNSGKVLITGGFSGRNSTSSAEVYDPKNKTFAVVGNMKIARGGHTATLLKDGTVLITGSENGEKSAEIFNPESEKFTEAGNMNVSRAAHTGTLLTDGKVLIAGGSYADNVTNTAEIFDATIKKFTMTGELSAVRYKHAAILLKDDNVLIVGGSDAKDWNGQYSTAELYEATKGTFKKLGNMNAKRFKIASALAALTDGKILIAGGDESLEIFDPQTQKFSVAEGKADAPRFYTTATALKNGNVLLIGGYDQSIKNNGKAWLYKK